MWVSQDIESEQRVRQNACVLDNEQSDEARRASSCLAGMKLVNRSLIARTQNSNSLATRKHQIFYLLLSFKDFAFRYSTALTAMRP